MSVSYEQFLESAREMAATSTGEMHQRNAISRAYYAAYHQLISVIPPDKIDRGVGMHKSYILQLQQCAPNSRERRLGLQLEPLYTNRITADYHLEKEVIPRDFAMHIMRIESIKTILETPESNRSGNQPQLKIVR